MEDMTEREYGYWINNIPGIGMVWIGRLLDYFGCAKEVFYASEEELAKIDKLSQKNILAIQSSKNIDKIKKSMEVLKRKGIEFVLRNEENYPKKLAEIYNPPWILYYRGDLPKDNMPSIGIVGARNCTEYGSIITRKLACELAQSGFQIISGMARGIDAYAHKGALEYENGKTFGILGCGIDTCYPPENIDIFMQTIRNGGIISEYPMYTSARAGNFPMRNRIISGLSEALLVVEARKKSGSLITVDLALEQGKEVYVIPGRMDDPLSEGCNNLIKMGAKIVTCVEDILEDYNIDYSRIIQHKTGIDSKDNLCTNNEENEILLASDEKIVYACLRLEPKHMDEILYETQLGLSEVIRILFSLEEKNMVISNRNNYYSRIK